MVLLAWSCSINADVVWEQTQINMSKGTYWARKTNQVKINKWTWWFVLPRFGSKEPSPRWGAHKGRVYSNPFPLSNGHLDRVSLLPYSHGSLRPRKDHHTLGVSCLAYKALESKRKKIRKAIQEARAQKNTKSLSLSQATKWLEWIWDLERFWSFELCLGVNARALVMNVMFKNLGYLKL